MHVTPRRPGATRHSHATDWFRRLLAVEPVTERDPQQSDGDRHPEAERQAHRGVAVRPHRCRHERTRDARPERGPERVGQGDADDARPCSAVGASRSTINASGE